MHAKFVALPFVTRRVLIALALFLLAFVSVHLPKNGFSETLCFGSLFGLLWAVGILVPLLKVTFFVLRWVLRYHVLFKY
ncbi:hypothetical protein AWB76_02471 [Caballeronia temeraria]|uniref:Uncharacterized protein n=2 Tax=Caballeronia TaxID=1827195 RepID=A0A158DQQ1_9BURK|nr:MULTISPECIES: hypothetical protein [Caballeronia]SAK57558.1 hypothetical protein AWB76_02471 [Caballeronia temeraria]SAK96057.1 hypothetical protein AWB75_06976 [Caballeronia catudaia]